MRRDSPGDGFWLAADEETPHHIRLDVRAEGSESLGTPAWCRNTARPPASWLDPTLL